MDALEAICAEYFCGTEHDAVKILKRASTCLVRSLLQVLQSA